MLLHMKRAENVSGLNTTSRAKHCHTDQLTKKGEATYLTTPQDNMTKQAPVEQRQGSNPSGAPKRKLRRLKNKN